MSGNFLRTRTTETLREAREKAKQLAQDPYARKLMGDLIDAARDGAVGAIDRNGDGKVSKIDVARAVFRPTKTLRRAGVGVAREVAGTARDMAGDSDTRRGAIDLARRHAQAESHTMTDPFVDNDPFAALLRDDGTAPTASHDFLPTDPFETTPTSTPSRSAKLRLRDRLRNAGSGRGADVSVGGNMDENDPFAALLRDDNDNLPF